MVVTGWGHKQLSGVRVSRYVYLVRHGEQVDAEFGLPDGPLSERGRAQAVHLADRLSAIQL